MRTFYIEDSGRVVAFVSDVQSARNLIRRHQRIVERVVDGGIYEREIAYCNSRGELIEPSFPTGQYGHYWTQFDPDGSTYYVIR